MNAVCHHLLTRVPCSWFEQTWQSMGTGFETPKRFRLKPLEERAFFSPTSRAMQVIDVLTSSCFVRQPCVLFSPQGMVRMWVDIMTPEQAKQYPRVSGPRS